MPNGYHYLYGDVMYLGVHRMYKTTNLGTKPVLRRNWWDSRAAQHTVWIGGAVLLLCVYLW